MVATRATKGKPATSASNKAKASRTNKGKTKATEVAPPTLEKRIADAPYWAKTL